MGWENGEIKSVMNKKYYYLNWTTEKLFYKFHTKSKGTNWKQWPSFWPHVKSLCGNCEKITRNFETAYNCRVLRNREFEMFKHFLELKSKLKLHEKCKLQFKNIFNSPQPHFPDFKTVIWSQKVLRNSAQLIKSPFKCKWFFPYLAKDLFKHDFKLVAKLNQHWIKIFKVLYVINHKFSFTYICHRPT